MHLIAYANLFKVHTAHITRAQLKCQNEFISSACLSNRASILFSVRCLSPAVFFPSFFPYLTSVSFWVFSSVQLIIFSRNSLVYFYRILSSSSLVRLFLSYFLLLSLFFIFYRCVLFVFLVSLPISFTAIVGFLPRLALPLFSVPISYSLHVIRLLPFSSRYRSVFFLSYSQASTQCYTKKARIMMELRADLFILYKCGW